MPFLSGYTKRKEIRYGTIFPDSNLTDFPKLFKITTDADIASELSDANGIAVTEDDGETPVPFGLYPISNLAAGTIIMRAKFPTILTAASTGDVLGYLYYDDTQTTTEDKAGVVDNSYALFMPMEEDPSGSSPQMFDWVTETNLGTTHGMDSGDLIDAQVAKGLDCTSDGYVTLTGPTLQNAFTISLILRTPSSFNAGQIFFRLNDGVVANAIWMYCFNSNGSTRLDDFDSTASDNAFNMTGSLSTSTYYKIEYRLGSGTQTYFRDGAGAGTNGYSGSRDTTSQPHSLGLAGNSDGSQPWQGYLDEVTISTVDRSDAWIEYGYNDDFSNSDTFTLGPEEVEDVEYPFWVLATLGSKRRRNRQLAIR